MPIRWSWGPRAHGQGSTFHAFHDQSTLDSRVSHPQSVTSSLLPKLFIRSTMLSATARLPMLDRGTAFFRTSPEVCRPCHYCCCSNRMPCPRYRSGNKDLSRDAEEVWWPHLVIPEGSRRRKGCLLAQDRLEPLQVWRSCKFQTENFPT